MKAHALKVAVLVLAFLLGSSGVWVADSYLGPATLITEQHSISESIHQAADAPRGSTPGKNGNILASNRLPRFEDYPVREIYQGRTARLRFVDDGTGARDWLRVAVEVQKVDFAGRYIVTSWSCGMWCSRFAVIDARTGKVYRVHVSPEVFSPTLTTNLSAPRTSQTLITGSTAS